tara:strand:+ start:5841 stop:6323 length:483 start_codon:yes stop_codon:yes gene_type:complete
MCLIKKFSTFECVQDLLKKMVKDGFLNAGSFGEEKYDGTHYFRLPISNIEPTANLEIMIEVPEDEPNKLSVWALIELHGTGLEVRDIGDVCFFYSINNIIDMAMISNELYTHIAEIIPLNGSIVNCNGKFHSSTIDKFSQYTAEIMRLAEDFNKRFVSAN